MEVILVHGMGRSRLSFALLAARLRAQGHRVRFLDYIAAFHRLDGVCARLQSLVRSRPARQPYALIGHSLGSVIIRRSLSQLRDDPPAVVCFLAAPLRACRAAKFFSRFMLYRLFTGEMGSLLADDAFMDQLPWPQRPRTRLRIYAATGGPRARWLPFGNAPNDGVLLLSEAARENEDVREVPGMHTLIMHSRPIADDILTLLDHEVTP